MKKTSCNAAAQPARQTPQQKHVRLKKQPRRADFFRCTPGRSFYRLPVRAVHRLFIATWRHAVGHQLQPEKQADKASPLALFTCCAFLARMPYADACAGGLVRQHPQEKDAMLHALAETFFQDGLVALVERLSPCHWRDSAK